MKNMDLAKVQETKARAATEPAALEVKLALDGEWRMDASMPQFGGEVRLPSGKMVPMESDFPAFLGGQGRAPSPLQLCFWGGMACFASTYAITAAQEGVDIKRLKLRTSATIDFRQATGMEGGEPVRDLVWEIDVEADATKEELERLAALAEERCPASWMMKNIVPVSARVNKL